MLSSSRFDALVAWCASAPTFPQMDRLIVELQLSPLEAYHHLNRIIEQVRCGQTEGYRSVADRHRAAGAWQADTGLQERPRCAVGCRNGRVVRWAAGTAALCGGLRQCFEHTSCGASVSLSGCRRPVKFTLEPCCGLVKFT